MLFILICVQDSFSFIVTTQMTYYILWGVLHSNNHSFKYKHPKTRLSKRLTFTKKNTNDISILHILLNPPFLFCNYKKKKEITLKDAWTSWEFFLFAYKILLHPNLISKCLLSDLSWGLSRLFTSFTSSLFSWNLLFVVFRCFFY